MSLIIRGEDDDEEDDDSDGDVDEEEGGVALEGKGLKYGEGYGEDVREGVMEAGEAGEDEETSGDEE